ncbi:hypothetical protein H6P81_018285 [Aristolochia fimbriata]|uniref:BHLH domain-containing protein n=1 Tax=Aristolochia fimbriata TaxID=158543 RepID=A0AAV7E244_ARIFI|nr:hypothetical protein H6P81_018285 [Aristolochia fimbriata]
MGEQCSETSVASSSTPNWWELHSSPLPSWSTSSNHPWQPRNVNPPSNSSCEEDMISISTSFTNASNHSGLSDDSPRDLAEPTSAATADLPGEPSSENHLWSQVLLGIGTSRVDPRNGSQDDTDNFLAALTSKTLTTEVTMFEPPCSDHYTTKKPDHTWEFSSMTYDAATSMEHETQYMVNNLKQEQPLYNHGSFANGSSSSYFQCYGHNNVPSSSSLARPASGAGLGYSHHMGSAHGLSDVPWSQTRQFADLISFGAAGCLNNNKPLMELQSSSSKINGIKGSVPAETNKKQGHEITLQTRGNGRGTGNQSEGKKKRTEDNSETLFKKPKNEGSTASSPKVQAPKVKLGDRITALQQIVSPFGKTDTASVLLEAIGYIKFLQEQVQLLSNPYLKTGASKDHTSWGALERDHNSEGMLDLRSRGLCLVPISFSVPASLQLCFCMPTVRRNDTEGYEFASSHDSAKGVHSTHPDCSINADNHRFQRSFQVQMIGGKEGREAEKGVLVLFERGHLDPLAVSQPRKSFRNGRRREREGAVENCKVMQALFPLRGTKPTALFPQEWSHYFVENRITSLLVSAVYKLNPEHIIKSTQTSGQILLNNTTKDDHIITGNRSKAKKDTELHSLMNLKVNRGRNNRTTLLNETQ